MQNQIRWLLICILLMQSIGCSNLPLSGLSPESILRVAKDSSIESKRPDNNSRSDSKIANPPARTLRFDGHEIVLGESENQAIDIESFINKLEPLVHEQKMQSASMLILRHRESAERLLSERWATHSSQAVVQLTAKVLSRRSSSTDMSWQTLLMLAEKHKAAAVEYQNIRNDFAEQLRTSDPNKQSAEQLLQASLKVNHALVRLDALRLLGLRELVAGRHAWAESQFRQAIDIAISSGNPLIGAELWLTVAEAARRNNQVATATSAWTSGLNLHLASHQPEQPFDAGFWLLADKTRPESASWPLELGATLAPNVQRLGCSPDGGSEMTLWASIAQAQLERGELQSALVNFKKAETLVHGSNAMWLRIAQAKCLAGMGQTAAASAILSGPAASPEASISAAATATMGSIKLQSGAYQQGAQLLQKALTKSPLTTWPSKIQSQADLAIAQLIFGDTDQGLAALHEAQRFLERSGELDQLIQSLENERKLLEHEHRSQDCVAIQSRIAELEQL